jgi:phage terminase large subunit
VTLPRNTPKAMRLWKQDPVAWIYDWLGVDLIGGPWEMDGQRQYQAEICYSVVDNSETFVVSGNGVGKDFITSCIVPWWMCTGRGIAITTAPTDRQVREILWGEIRSRYKKAVVPLGGRMFPAEPKWLSEDAQGRGGTDKWYARGYTATDENAWQGRHSDRVLVVGDEAAGIPLFVWPAMMGCAVGADDRMLWIGNPTCGPDHQFAKSASSPDIPGKKMTIRVKSTETPNYRTGKELIPGLMTREGVERIVRKYGKNSAITNARVNAIFPVAGAESLIGYQHIQPCRDRHAQGSKPTDRELSSARIGCDVARHGDDLAMAYICRGPEVIHPKGWPKPMCDQVEITDALAALSREFRPLTVAIDGGAMGPGPIDYLRSEEHRKRLKVPEHTRILEVLFGAKASDEEQFMDRRTEIWVLLRDWLQEVGAMEIDEELEEELLAPTIKWVGKRLKLEPKVDTKKRLGRSPDRADALALAVSGHIGQPISLVLTGYGGAQGAPESRIRRGVEDWDAEDNPSPQANVEDVEAFLDGMGSDYSW